MKKIIQIVFIAVLTLLAGCSSNNNDDNPVELTISAAASMKDALTEIQTEFEKEHPSINLFFNFGSSGALQKQIKQGAPVDLYISASKEKFAQLVNDGLIDSKDGNPLVSNQLVLIVSKQTTLHIKTFNDLINIGETKIAIGIPGVVPAGSYAKESLETMGLWEPLKEKLIQAKDVRQVLTYVETGNVDAGIVYATDAMVSSEVTLVASAPFNTHSPIVYFSGTIKDSPYYTKVQQFYQYLQEEDAMTIFKKYGFLPPDAKE